MVSHRGDEVSRIPTYSRSVRSESVRGEAASVLAICSSVTLTVSPRPASAAVNMPAGM